MRVTVTPREAAATRIKSPARTTRHGLPGRNSCARGPPTDWGELVQVHDDRNVFQATDRRTARDRYSQPLTGVGHEASKARGGPTGTRSAPTREKRHRRGMRGVLADRFPTDEAPNLAAQGQSVSRKTVAEVPLTGLSFLERDHALLGVALQLRPAETVRGPRRGVDHSDFRDSVASVERTLDPRS